MAGIEPISNALPPGWNASKDQNGYQYYYNKDQNVTQWSRPEFPGGGGVAVGRGGDVGGGGSSGLGGGGMVGGGIVGGGALELNTAAIQMQMLPMPQMFQQVHVPVGPRPVFTSPAANMGPNAMPGGVVGRVDHSAAAQLMLEVLRVNTSRDRVSEKVSSPTPHVPIPPMSAPLKPSYRDLSIRLGLRFRDGGAEAAAGACQRQKCSQT
jgi:hypothetical protein